MHLILGPKQLARHGDVDRRFLPAVEVEGDQTAARGWVTFDRDEIRAVTSAVEDFIKGTLSKPSSASSYWA